ncbi:MAG: hypothetical protein ACLR71_16955 [[Clostridium] scindens]
MAGTDYKEMDVTTDPGSSVIKDYRMNSVTLGHSWNDSPYNDGIKEQTVGAKVYVQTTLAQKEQDEWPAEPYKVIEDLSPQDGVKVEFDEGEHVIGVKVEVYQCTGRILQRGTGDPYDLPEPFMVQPGDQ